MKKLFKSCLVILLVLVGLGIAALGAAAYFDLCPPAGPWPPPPWCDGSEKPVVFSPQDLSLNVASPLSFTVQVPPETPEGTVVYLEAYTPGGIQIHISPMEEQEPGVWSYNDIGIYTLLQANSSLKYRYTRNGFGYTGGEELLPDSPDTLRMISVGDDLKLEDTVTAWRWVPGPDYEIPQMKAQITEFAPRVEGLEFQKGMGFADWWWDSFEPLLETTNQRMADHNITWVEIAPAWDYTRINPTPIISNQAGHSYPDQKLRLHLDTLVEDGFSIYLQPQICCTGTEGASYPQEWWQGWYEQYQAFLLYHVNLANEYGIDYLVVGGTDFVLEMKPEGYQEQLAAIFRTAADAYDGKLGWLLSLGSNPQAGHPTFYPELEWLVEPEIWDFFAINFWVGFADSPDPTPDELDANLDEIFTTYLALLYDQYGAPVVLEQIAYPSVDGALMGLVDVFDPAIALWEPYSDKFQLDLEEQALGYDAVMRAVARHEYVTGTYAFAYMPDEYPISKEYNVRGKPAEEVLSQWYQSIP